MEQPTFAFSNDGSVTDVAAFRAALRSDPSKMQALQADPSAAAVLLDADDGVLQAFLRETFQVRRAAFRATAGTCTQHQRAEFIPCHRLRCRR